LREAWAAGFLPYHLAQGRISCGIQRCTLSHVSRYLSFVDAATSPCAALISYCAPCRLHVRGGYCACTCGIGRCWRSLPFDRRKQQKMFAIDSCSASNAKELGADEESTIAPKMYDWPRGTSEPKLLPKPKVDWRELGTRSPRPGDYCVVSANSRTKHRAAQIKPRSRLSALGKRSSKLFQAE
jgi:hypothetical protein